VAPESEDVQMSQSATARWVPVESDATFGVSAMPESVVCFVQVAPPSEVVHTSPPDADPSGPVTATRRVPVESDATDAQA
jgi:hypothetical protein